MLRFGFSFFGPPLHSLALEMEFLDSAASIKLTSCITLVIQVLSSRKALLMIAHLYSNNDCLSLHKRVSWLT